MGERLSSPDRFLPAMELSRVQPLRRLPIARIDPSRSSGVGGSRSGDGAKTGVGDEAASCELKASCAAAAFLREDDMSDDEGPDWKPRIINAETVVQEVTLENGAIVRMHLHFGEYDMVHFERMCRLHPICRYTAVQPCP